MGGTWGIVRTLAAAALVVACAPGGGEDDGGEVTRAWPARRFVELAQSFGDRGYVYSICNADWSVAMSELAGLIPLKTED